MHKNKQLYDHLKRLLLRYAVMSIIVAFAVAAITLYVLNERVAQPLIKNFEAEIENRIQRETDYSASNINKALQHIGDSVSFLSREEAYILSHPEEYPIHQFEYDMIVHENSSVYKAYDETKPSVYYSGISPQNDYTKQKVLLTNWFDQSFIEMFATHDFITQIYFNSFDTMNRIYPPITDSAILFGGSFDILDYNFYYLADAYNNPKRGIVWTKPYFDPAGSGWMVSCIAPVYQGDFLEGVTGIDVTIDTLNSHVLSEYSNNNTPVMITDQEGHVISMNQELKTILDIDTITNEQLMTKHILRDFEFEVDMSTSWESNHELSYFISTSHIPEADWKIYVLTDESIIQNDLDHKTARLINSLFISGSIMLIIILFMAVIYISRVKKLSKNVSDPITKLSAQIRQFGKDSKSLGDFQASGIEELDGLKDEFGKMTRLINERTKLLIDTQMENKRAEDTIERHRIEATTDQLTNVYNRRKFDDAFDVELNRSKRYRSEFSLTIIDIDYFKEINDSHGHSAGDDVLKQIAQILKDNIRTTDIVARWGGDEFVLLTMTGEAQTILLAEKIHRAISDFTYDDKHITISIGVAEVNVDLDDSRSLLNKADLALYEAKTRGRNCSVAYSEIEHKHT